MSKRHDSPLGKVPESWSLIHLKDVAEKVKSGATPRGGDSGYLPSRDRFALIRSQNVFDRRFDETGLAFISDKQAGELAGAEVQAGDALLNITGDGITFARSTLVPKRVLPACVNQHVMLIRPRQDKCDPGFLLSYLTHPQIKDYIESFNAGGSRRAITKSHIESFVIPLPPLSEQRAIASVLGALDDKIELNRRMNETLEAMARALFQNWFMDATQTHIPKGWRKSTLGELIELAYGKALKAEDRQPGEIPVFGSNGQIGWHNEKLVQGPGIVVGRKGNPGIVTWSPTDFFPIDTTFYVVPKGECGSLYFLFYVLLAHDLASLGADSAVPGLNRNVAYLSQQVVPPTDILEKFDGIVSPFFEKIHANVEESRTLAALRDALLPKLLSGELRVSGNVHNLDHNPL